MQPLFRLNSVNVYTEKEMGIHLWVQFWHGVLRPRVLWWEVILDTYKQKIQSGLCWNTNKKNKNWYKIIIFCRYFTAVSLVVLKHMKYKKNPHEVPSWYSKRKPLSDINMSGCYPIEVRINLDLIIILVLKYTCLHKCVVNIKIQSEVIYFDICQN